MSKSIADFVEQLQRPIESLSDAECREELDTFRGLWSWIPDNVKYLTYRIGSTVRVVKRDYKGSAGELGAIKWQVEEYELAVQEKRYDESLGRFMYEQKVVQIPSGTVMMLEFIQKSISAEEVEQEEVIGIASIED